MRLNLFKSTMFLLLAVSRIQPVTAHWIHLAAPVPVERLQKNVETYVKSHPLDSAGYYTLGRIHSLAFAEGTATIEAILPGQRGNDGALPTFGPRGIMAERASETGVIPMEARVHLLASVRNYQRATQLAPKEALYFLGLGWMLEQGMLHSPAVVPPPGEGTYAPANIPTRERWRNGALAAYRRAYRLAVKDDLARGSVGPSPDSNISLEAADGILRLLNGQPLSARERSEVAALKKTEEVLIHKPRIMTPIVFSMRPGAAVEDLLAPRTRVQFDLSGLEEHSTWPWVKPDTGILVWDPTGAGKITSGRQLFGSVTWWIFWKDGYGALAALDDDHNGWLEGRELKGIAVWFDRNGNGISDPGEVVPLQSLGIDRIAVQSAGRNGGTLWNNHGFRRTDGTFLPSYDWTPTEVVGK